jgi:asparagine synthase (glutamine-hydrolysing)
MCGISCLINNTGVYTPVILDAFTDAASHRGPDARGAAFFDTGGKRLENPIGFRLGLGHRRLSIIDLSECGAQPMSIDGGNFTIVYNGEIYNYLEIRKELEAEGVRFESHSDTEVLLSAYARWGRNCLDKFNGMWAFVIYDRRKNILFVSRDRLGVKPLYYRKHGANLAIGSEIKQFFQLPDFAKKINEHSLPLYLATGYENPPETFFDGILAFPPGHYAEIAIGNPKLKPERFWNYDKISAQDADAEFLISKISETFSDAVRLRLRSDVPVGGCLSGGLDSSAIFAEMKKHSPDSAFRAFSACFDDPRIDERPFMKSIVDKTQSIHIEVFPKAEDLADGFDKFLFHHDEPVGSLSMYAQFRVMKSARENKVPVLLDGQGGDELFSGYWPSYMLLFNKFRRDGRIDKIFSHLAGAILPMGNPELICEILRNICEFRRRAARSLPFILNEKSDKILSGLPQSKWHVNAQKLSPEEYRKAEIFRVHLPRLLKWEDRNSMAFSVESRVPFLDYRLVELLLSIPPEMNMRRGWTKYLFRKAMNGKLPDAICWRKDKKGFETPQSKWMKSGAFHKILLEWAGKKEHPVSEFISSGFCEIRKSLQSGDFDSTAMFRLFCADKWMNAF